MSKKLDPKDNELYKRVDEILHYIWDPIGVFDEPYARDEYYSYLPIIYSLLKESKENQEIEDKLIQIQRDQMELSTISKDKIKKVVELLVSYRNIIYTEST
jgi:hypothetical protein